MILLISTLITITCISLICWNFFASWESVTLYGFCLYCLCCTIFFGYFIGGTCISVEDKFTKIEFQFAKTNSAVMLSAHGLNPTHGLNQVFTDIAPYNKIDKIKYIYLHRHYNSYGFL